MPLTIACPHCRVRLKFDHIEIADCPWCGEAVFVRCPDCDGSGDVYSDRGPDPRISTCLRCRGAGIVQGGRWV